MPDDSWPIIVGGFYRSGTSLMRRLINAHPDIFCGPEVKFFHDFFGKFRDDAHSHLRFFKNVRSLGLDEEQYLSLFGTAYVTALQAAAEKNGKKRWADKAPENVLYLNEWAQLLESGFFFLHVVRHPLDALASLIEIGFPRTIPESFSDKVVMYDQFLRDALAYERSHPGECVRVRYEDFVLDPMAISESLFTALDAPIPDKDVLTTMFDRDTSVGLEDPKIRNTDRVLRGSVGRWRNELSERQIDQATAVLLQHMEYLEYDLEDVSESNGQNPASGYFNAQNARTPRREPEE